MGGSLYEVDAKSFQTEYAEVSCTLVLIESGWLLTLPSSFNLPNLSLLTNPSKSIVHSLSITKGSVGIISPGCHSGRPGKVEVVVEQAGAASSTVCALVICFDIFLWCMLFRAERICFFSGRRSYVLFGSKRWMGRERGRGQGVGIVTPGDDCFYNIQKPNLNGEVLLWASRGERGTVCYHPRAEMS